ncbi:MAG: hypothetical protein IPF99_33555 [Deltaproteobacteria bacterium]|nr:hypothetical protein [Deltaproteobacteria bacterium]
MQRSSAGESDGSSIHEELDRLGHRMDYLERHVSEAFHEEVNRSLFRAYHAGAETLRAADAFAVAGLPDIEGVGFDSSRHGGVLMESIPELDIEAPAIVIAPANIVKWAATMPTDWAQHCTDASRIWLGARFKADLPLAAAIGNVVQHEMTHAMLRLANDAPEESDQSGSQHALYRRRPDIEEGIANFVAALTTSMAVMKSLSGVIGPKPLDLTTKRHGPTFAKLRPLIAWTFANYYDETSDAYLNALDGNARNFKAFGGLLAMFATDHASIDWDATAEALTRGVISTTKLPAGRRP